MSGLTYFITVFDAFSIDPKSSAESICGAIRHLKNVKSFEFAFIAHIFNDIFLITNHLFNTLQTKSFDIEYCVRKIKVTSDLIKQKRDDEHVLNYYNTAVELTKHTTSTRQNSKNELSYKMLFYEVIDNVIMQLNTRFSNTDKLHFLQLGDVSKFKEYSTTFPDSEHLDKLELS